MDLIGAGGMPPELQRGIERALAAEPRHDEPEVAFSHRPPPRTMFTLWRFLAPHWPLLVLGVVLVAIETAALQAGPLLLQRGIDRGVLAGDSGAVLVAAALFLASVVLSVAVMRVRIAWTGRFGQRLMERLRIDVFTHVQRLSQSFFTNERSGRLMTRLTSDIDALSQLLQDGIINLVVQGFTLAIVVAVLFTMHAPLALVVVGVVVPVMVALTLWFRRASDRAYVLERDRIAEVLTDLQENLAGARVVIGANRVEHNASAHRAIVGRHRDANILVGRVAGVYAPSVDAVGALGEAVILLVGGGMLLRGSLSLGELTAFVLYLAAFFAPIQQLVNLYNTYQSGRAAVRKLDALLATQPAVLEAPDAVDLPRVAGEVRFEAVSFAYGDGPLVLDGVDLVVAPGETLALAGPTGAGKSTLAKLVTRAYDPTAGRILIDGHDVRGVTLASLRRQVGVVPQEPFLFSGTVRDNLLLGVEDADDDELRAICRLVGLDALLDRLPAGLDSTVSERGVALASGERQLLAIARALLPRPRVLVLDEATSNLDLASEAAVERAFDVALQGRTGILIAHRLSTAMRADRIAVVADGRIAELGAHAELVAAGGLYARMYATWTEHGGLAA
jgi:ATP-binding cassette subfamily B protein